MLSKYRGGSVNWRGRGRRHSRDIRRRRTYNYFPLKLLRWHLANSSRKSWAYIKSDFWGASSRLGNRWPNRIIFYCHRSIKYRSWLKLRLSLTWPVHNSPHPRNIEVATLVILKLMNILQGGLSMHLFLTSKRGILKHLRHNNSLRQVNSIFLTVVRNQVDYFKIGHYLSTLFSEILRKRVSGWILYNANKFIYAFFCFLLSLVYIIWFDFRASYGGARFIEGQILIEPDFNVSILIETDHVLVWHQGTEKWI